MFNANLNALQVKIKDQYDFIAELRAEREICAEIVKQALLRGDMDHVAEFTEDTIAKKEQIDEACVELDRLRIENINS